MQQFSTEILTIEDILGNSYNIPPYQRPYVWGKEHLDKLILDFWNAYQKDEEQYFIGTILVSRQNGIFELIDGQQRFTTLWLLAFSFLQKEDSPALTHFLTIEGKLRIGFAIREQVEKYLHSLILPNAGDTSNVSESEINNDPYLSHIAKAVTTIQNCITQLEYTAKKSKTGFADFIFRRVKFVKNITSDDYNLNKLFITTNNSGIQLEQTDILKSNLLRQLDADKKMYSLIWECCEQMSDFFPANVKLVFSNADWKNMTIEDLSEFKKEWYDASYGEYTEQEPGDTMNIGAIINSNPAYKNGKSSLRKQTPNGCRSIINFSQVLLHTYRIHLKLKGKADFTLPFHTNNLLSIFEGLNNAAEIRVFLHLLWQIRFIFDAEVIKWVEHESYEEALSLCKVSINKEGSVSWDITGKKELTMLQSVLYYTSNPNTQIWLTPFLYRLLKKEEIDTLAMLESIDNKLSISFLEDKTVAFNLMEKDYSENNLFDFVTYLQQNLGTSFKHYWFQKLEYVLWKNWEQSDNRLLKYRITSKNSVEHVLPQHPKFDEKMPDHEEWVDSFGNLGLLNVSQNSSYSNQDVRKKKADFDSKHTYDSLKLARIYLGVNIEGWPPVKIQNHRDEMIEALKKHYGIG